MKNILARGGIEFLAVLLGISGSLWIENNKELAEINKQINNSLIALSSSLKSDKQIIENAIESYEKNKVHFEFIQNIDSVKKATNSRLQKAFERTGVPGTINLDATIFNSMESSGLIYKIKNETLRNAILKVYQKYYLTLTQLNEYDLNTIQKMDDVVLENFILSNKTIMWNLDYNHSSTRNNIINNQLYQKFICANKSNKAILNNRCKRLLEKIEELLEMINKNIK